MILVASGGMYTVPLDVAALEPTPAEYDGVKAYARCKRAQVALAGEWTRHLAGTGVTVNAMHPGWADTPGLRDALPGLQPGALADPAHAARGRRHDRVARGGAGGRPYERRVLPRPPGEGDPPAAPDAAARRGPGEAAALGALLGEGQEPFVKRA